MDDSDLDDGLYQEIITVPQEELGYSFNTLHDRLFLCDSRNLPDVLDELDPNEREHSEMLLEYFETHTPAGEQVDEHIWIDFAAKIDPQNTHGIRVRDALVGSRVTWSEAADLGIVEPVQSTGLEL